MNENNNKNSFSIKVSDQIKTMHFFLGKEYRKNITRFSIMLLKQNLTLLHLKWYNIQVIKNGIQKNLHIYIFFSFLLL